MDTVLGMILVLGVMILVHEWGHFVVARLFGVRVDVFSVGFGPRLFGWKRGATDYRVSALPLGGYVRMAGQELSEIDSGQQGPTGAPDEVMSKPRWQRALISFAGPAVNLIMPILLLGGFFWLRGQPYQASLNQPSVIAAQAPDDPLKKAGIEPGDRIVSINGTATPTWQTAEDVISSASPDSTAHLAIEHQGAVRQVDVPVNEFSKQDTHGVGPRWQWYLPGPTVAAEVTKGDPAARAGMQRDDRVLSVNGKAIPNWFVFVDTIKQSNGAPLQVVVARNGTRQDLTIQPEPAKDADGSSIYRIGVRGPKETQQFRRVSFASAFGSASSITWSGTKQLVDVVGKLVTGRLSIKQLQGVVGIADRAGEAVQEGTFAVVSLMAIISLNLGVLNLLPIPILDGGHILLLAIEGIRRRDLSLAFKERFVQVGFVFLLLLFVVVMYNDIVRLLPIHS